MPSQEGFGFPALEAMDRGVPTAVAASGSLPEVTRGAAVIIDPNDPSTTAVRIAELASDAALRARLIKDGKEVAAQYRWAATAEGVWRIVEAVRSM